MGFLNNGIVPRILIIIFLSGLAVYLWTRFDLIMPAILSLLIPFYLTIDILRLYRRQQKNLELFLSSIHMDDGSLKFKTEGNGIAINDKRISRAMNRILSDFQRLRNEKEMNHHLLHAIVEQVKTPLFVFEAHNGKIVYVNQALYNLVGRNVLFNISDFRSISYDLFVSIERVVIEGELTVTLAVADSNEILKFQSTTLTTLERPLHIVTVEDVKFTISQTEVSAWHRMLRVISHEIVNTTQPIQTTISDMKHLMNEERQIHPEDILEKLTVIKERTSGLEQFVRRYRQLLVKPQLNLRQISIVRLIERAAGLYENDLKSHNIELVVDSPEIEAKIDLELIEQVIINLIKNSIDALVEAEVEDAKITITVTDKSQVTRIEIEDNGPGVPDDLKDDIFTPMFSTKDSGSGVGLSLGRQIMQWHKGSLELIEKPKGAKFRLVLPK